MAWSSERAAHSHQEREVTDALEVVAIAMSAIAAAAGIGLAGLERRAPPASGHLRRQGTDQRWRGRPATVADLTA